VDQVIATAKADENETGESADVMLGEFIEEQHNFDVSQVIARKLLKYEATKEQ